MPLQLFWRRADTGSQLPSAVVYYASKNEMRMQALCGPEIPIPPELLLHEVPTWPMKVLRWVFRRPPPDIPYLTTEYPSFDTQDGTRWRDFQTRSSFLPSPKTIPGQSRWRFRHPALDQESGVLVVTTTRMVTTGWKADAELNPSVDISLPTVADASISLAEAGAHFARVTVSALDDPSIVVRLLTSWSETEDSLAQVVRECAVAEYGDEYASAVSEELTARMRNIGVIGPHFPGWSVELGTSEFNLNSGEQADVQVAVTAEGRGRVLLALEISDSDTGDSFLTDLLAVRRL